MIIDCSIYFNESDLFYLRLLELGDYVDKFVVIEADKTHHGDYKGYNFNINNDLYQKYINKIIHYKISLKSDSPWGREIENRNRLYEILYNLDLNNNDCILISDADEIPNSQKIQELQKFDLIGLNQMNFVHFYNCWAQTCCVNTFSIKYKYLKEINAQTNNMAIELFRRNKNNLPKINNGGWHYSYICDEQGIYKKSVSIAEGNKNNNLNQFDGVIDKAITTNKSPFAKNQLMFLDIHNLKFLNLKYETVTGSPPFEKWILEEDNYQIASNPIMSIKYFNKYIQKKHE
jgi:hypothetical protein